MANECLAVVCYPPNPGPNWRVDKIRLLRQPRENELKIRMVASGLCHTDIFMSSLPETITDYPKIVGHEGAGIVEEIGARVQVASVGDPVLLSYNYCKQCELCKAGQEPYCLRWPSLNVFGEKGIVEAEDGQQISGKFFGQSSFSAVSIVSEASVVNVKDAIKNHEELKLLAPLGCGLMTGSGAVVNAARAQSHDIVLVTGLGAVGLGAIMAAKISGCKEIIAVDRVQSRLEIAKDLGATRVLDTSDSGVNLAQDIRKLLNDQRISYAIETTGNISVINNAIQALGQRGKLIQVGIPRPGSDLTIPLSEFYRANKIYETHLLGDTCGQVMVPRMLEWYRDGRFPIEKIVQFVPIESVLDALLGMEGGTIIKPVLVW